jgi:hypothetical protein
MPRFRAVLALLHALALATAFALSPPVARAQPAPDAAETIFQQLDAFRRNDYDAAYAFASGQIRQLFDRRAFEQMVRRGYPEIAESTRAHVAERTLGPDGHAYLRLKIRGANGQRVEAVYEMVQEGGTWRINGVVARPDPGEEV